MAIPDYQSLMLPVLECISDGREWRIPECSEKVAENLNLSSEDKELMLPSGKQTVLYNRIAWSVTYMEKANLIERTKRGYFKITDRGQVVLKEKPILVNNNYLSKFPEFQRWREKSKEISEIKNNNDYTQNTFVETTVSPEEQLENANQALLNQLKIEIIEYLTSDLVSPALFEKIIVDLMIAMGYGGGRAEMGRALGRSGDNGVDGVIREDSLGLDVIYIQAKKYKQDSSIGRPDIQNFVGSLEGFNATKGVFVTTSFFANTAKEYVERIHKRIVLIDGSRLAELMIRHNIGVRHKATYELKKLDEDYFME